MGCRAIWLVPGAWALLATVIFACSSSDPGSVVIEPGHGKSLTGPDMSTTGGKKHSDSGTSSDGMGEDVASDGSDDMDQATLEDGGAPLFGAAAYKGMPVATSAATLHSMMGGPSDPGYQMACLSCHGAGTKDTQFLFAGSIYTDVDGGTGAQDIEVRVVDSKGKGTNVYSDTDGNFWATGTSTLSAPARCGARNAVSVQIMPSSLTSGDCNGCHDGTTKPIMHLP